MSRSKSNATIIAPCLAFLIACLGSGYLISRLGGKNISLSIAAGLFGAGVASAVVKLRKSPDLN